jgi:CheY-like chemotaxis protein
MTDRTAEFGTIAKGLSRSPLGIIALFIVLVYALASLVMIFAGSMQPNERMPLIYFLIVFPFVVFGMFSWLVVHHSDKLFGPSDFRNEENYIKMKLSAAVALGAASAKTPAGAVAPDTDAIVRTVLRLPTDDSIAPIKNKVLWVDDRPDNNIHEREAFQAVGIDFALSLNTADALDQLSKQNFAAVISDMGRKEGPREGYVLLDAMRARGDRTPLFFYAASAAPEHRQETQRHGGQGCTNDANELFGMVTRAVFGGERSRPFEPRYGDRSSRSTRYR